MLKCEDYGVESLAERVGIQNISDRKESMGTE